MKSNKLLYTLIGLTIAAVIAGIIFGSNKNKNKSKEVELEKVSARNIVQTVTASGKIYPEEEVKISSDVSGEIIELSVKEGDVVQKGKLLARIKPESYQANVEQTQANINNMQSQLSSAKSRIAQAQAQYNNALNTFNRTKELYNKKIISKAEYQNAETALNSAKADVEAAKHNAEAAGYSMKASQAIKIEANINLSKTTIYAPMNGIISLLNVKQGEKVVGTLQMSGTEMMRIANFEYMEVRVDVSESEIIKVKVGDTAEVEVDAYLDRKFLGIVTEVANTSKGASASSVLSTDQSTNFVVKIRILLSSYQDLLTETAKPFLPGMSATVSIRTKTKEGVIAVPIQAVTTKDTVINGSTKTLELVYVDENGKAKIRYIKTGIQNNEYIEVLEGLKGNETIIKGPYNVISKDLKENDAVKEKVEKDKGKDKKDEEDKE